MARRLTYRISVCLTPEHGQEVEDYIGQKKRWKKPSDLLRDALVQFMAKNKLSAAQERRVRELHGK